LLPGQRGRKYGAQRWQIALRVCLCGSSFVWPTASLYQGAIVGRRRRRKRTSNIKLMSVTLEVSKLSGWLKASASCQVQRRHPSEGNACGTEMWHRGKGESAARAACVCGPARELGQKAQAEAHGEHPAHARDSGGVKAQRLVESTRTLPSPKGASVKGKRVWHRDVARSEGRISSARGVCVWPSSGVCGQKAQAEAHMKHVAHACDAGGIKAQRLVESSRSLPSSKGAPVRGKRVWHGDVAQREGRISSARGVRLAQLGSVGAEGAGGSAQRTCCSCS